MDTTSQPKQIPVSQVSDTLEQTVANLDQARAADLDEMSQVRTAKFTGLARDRARLAAKLGETDPRVVALDRSIALHGETTAGFRSESAAASVTPPHVTAQSWALHGNVLDASRKPIQGVTVALYEKNSWVQRLGFACTDANGYFVLLVEDAAKADAKDPLSINVLMKGKVIYIDPIPLTIQAGHAEYREIVIGKSQEVCSPPGGEHDAPAPPTSAAPSPATAEPSFPSAEPASPATKRSPKK